VVVVLTAAAPAVDELAVCCLQCIELAVLREECQVAIYRGQADRFTGGAQFGVYVLRTAEAL
jgi:hypothetical protein